MFLKSFLLFILSISLISCSSDNEGTNLQSDATDMEMQSENDQDNDQSTSQVYDVTLVSLWNSTDHVRVPGNAHFSPLVIAVHNNTYSLFPIGELAGNALEQVAELGQTRSIREDLSQAQATNQVLSFSTTQDQFVLNQTEQSFQVEISTDHPLLSIVSMIAPSPDWVIGVSSLALANEEGFLEERVEIELHAYNAGTEEGDIAGNYSLNNRATVPQQPISRLQGQGFDEPFARLIITPAN